MEEIIKVDDKMLLIPFPSPDKAEALADYLNSKYGIDYLVFNVSEHQYDPKLFNNQVVDYTFPGYPCPPLEATFILLKQIDSWLASADTHVAVVNCQATRVFEGDITRFSREAAWSPLSTSATVAASTRIRRRRSLGSARYLPHPRHRIDERIRPGDSAVPITEDVPGLHGVDIPRTGCTRLSQ